MVVLFREKLEGIFANNSSLGKYFEILRMSLKTTKKNVSYGKRILNFLTIVAILVFYLEYLMHLFLMLLLI